MLSVKHRLHDVRSLHVNYNYFYYNYIPVVLSCIHKTGYLDVTLIREYEALA